MAERRPTEFNLNLLGEHSPNPGDCPPVNLQWNAVVSPQCPASPMGFVWLANVFNEKKGAVMSSIIFLLHEIALMSDKKDPLDIMATKACTKGRWRSERDNLPKRVKRSA